MKLLRLVGLTVAISLSAVAASAQMSDQSALPSPAGGKQDAQQQEQQRQSAPGDRPVEKTPTPPEQLQNKRSQPQPPTVPGTGNENKADPTSQNNPK